MNSKEIQEEKDIERLKSRLQSADVKKVERRLLKRKITRLQKDKA